MLKLLLLGFFLSTILFLTNALVTFILIKRFSFFYNLKTILLQWISTSIILSLILVALDISYLKSNEILYFILIVLSTAIIPSIDFFIYPYIYYIVEQPVIDEESTAWLSNHCESSLKICVINKNITNAYATGILPQMQMILIGKNMKEKMSFENLQCILLHELGHLKRGHLVILYLVNVICTFLSGYLFFIFNKSLLDNFGYAVLLSLVVGAIVTIIPAITQRFLEYDADKFASKRIGVDNYIEMLIKFDEITQGGLSRITLNYPSLKQRINHVKK